MINFTEQSVHGKYQELPEIQESPKKTTGVSNDHHATDGLLGLQENVCHIYNDPDGSTAVVYIANIKPAAVYNFVSNLENFVNLSPQIRCAVPKNKGNRARKKTCQILETAEATFQAQDPETALVVTFISKNTLGEKLTSTFTVEDHPLGGTQIVNKVVLSELVEKSNYNFLLCCGWDERLYYIKADQKCFLNGLSAAIHASTSPLVLYDDEYLV